MAFEDLFTNYPNKNLELRNIAKTAYEFGRNIAQEPSAGMSTGLDQHGLNRQKDWVAALSARLEAFHSKPVPDMPYVHPTRFDIDMSEPYKQFTVDGMPINEDTQLLAEYWMVCAVELAKSQSAGMAGSIIDADYERIKNDIGVISKFIDEIENRPVVDLPETAFPGAELAVPTENKTK
jgi:hypothetical protein